MTTSIGFRYIRSNVRVAYDDASDLYAQARLQYKVRFLFFFYRWVTVNSSYYEDGRGNLLTPDIVLKYLKSEGQKFKSIKLNDRAFNRKV
jgi:hypothetical protein